MSIHKMIVAAAFAAAVSAGATSPAAAQTPDPAAVEKAKEHFARGKELYDAGNKPAAVEEFKEAYRLTRNALLLYNVGLVYDEIGDVSMAVFYYEKYLADAPDDDRTREQRQLARLRLRALKTQPATPEPEPKPEPEVSAPEPGPEAPPRAPSVTAFTHELVEEAPPNKPLDISARIPRDADWLLTLHYRKAGDDTFQVTRMRQRYDEYLGRIPARWMTGTSVQYYIEVKDRSGKLVDR